MLFQSLSLCRYNCGREFRLLIKTPQANLSRAMRHINGVYTQRYNRSNKTDGALFRGRYKSILVDSDAYLLHLSKYIHLNPIAARLVDCLEQYEWSSYSAYIKNKINFSHISLRSFLLKTVNKPLCSIGS